ncbi:hypothetical protein [Burkholderia stagnalis]|uniref:hypothetical protein n=1 Tax=Burkholderia stagnalis TaxID=1503054 RepID=UPI000F55E75C|nr:hypothetical protein [Burkholderia stagnalis]RQQ54284.1 hypothetical protein DF145_05185 [Burkholderia stagnalis]RQY03951.1 hypothetical protein DF121_08225 [Burkholderia stagnalis]RQY21632.1 hypothetical protein DF115_06400 [Burkholderia stagnalis]RQY32165.1 hypothetical protein DF114_12000 [Burkholderia stagnalis]
MSASDYLLDLGHPVAYYPGLVKHLGSVNAVLFFSQIFYWQDKAASELGVYKTVEEIEAETGMTYREQATARKQLVERGVLVETNKRLEHRVYYRIDLDRLNEMLESANCGKRISGEPDSAVRGAAKAQVVNKTKTTTETTSKSTADTSAKCDVVDEKFDEAWRQYPKREGSNSKQAAQRAWNARIREGIDPETLVAAVKGYAAAMKAAGSIGTPYVKQASTFFGRDRHFEEFAKSPPAGSDLFAGGDAIPWWKAAGFTYQWQATNAGCSERSAHLWANGVRQGAPA